MAEQSIKIKIASRDYPLKASSPEQERAMRLASESINKMIEYFSAKFPMQSEQDKLAFASLNASMSLLAAKKELADIQAEGKALLEQMQAYLDNIEK